MNLLSYKTLDTDSFTPKLLLILSNIHTVKNCALHCNKHFSNNDTVNIPLQSGTTELEYNPRFQLIVCTLAQRAV